MKIRILVLLALTFAWAAQARDHTYDKGIVMQMQAAACGTSQKGGNSVVGDLVGVDNEHKTTQQLLCQEYTLQADHVIYKIRPKDDKHPILLPIGGTAKFRIEKDRLILRVPEMGDKEREYIVVSMTPRTNVADSRPAPKSDDH
jgi:hypothetical protein